mmetsp:Transcript_23840/g.71510  ORF Transcript_23840/g.71510 Transcript_23840/m.71510 type:complete len:115 (+) Transcript_23840:213-557(+)
MAHFKVSKLQAQQLFLYVRRLAFRFDAFSEEARPLREMWRQVTAPRMLAANPKCKVDVDLVKGAAPALDVEFVDGIKMALPRTDRPAAELVSELYREAHNISLEYAIAGKPPPG